MFKKENNKSDLAKKTMLIFHPALAPYRVDFFNCLSRQFRTYFYFLFSNVPTQEFDQNELQKDCEFDCNYLEKGYDFFGKSFRVGIFKTIIKKKPDIIMCSEYGPITFLLLFYYKLSHKKFRLYSISDDSLDLAIKRKGLRALVRNIICKNTDGIIFNSIDVAAWHKDNISKRMKELVLPIIHKDESFRNKLIESIPVAKRNINEHGLSNKRVILYVGRLEKVKNIDFLIDCYQQANLKNSALVIVGDGRQRESLEEVVKNGVNPNSIIFTGRLEGEDLLSWYLIADLFVLPSTYEPFGAVINEALLAGCHVLCSSDAGASSLITKDNGVLFSPYRKDDLTQKMISYMNEHNPTARKMVKMRDSKMPFTFDQSIKTLMDKLNSV